MDPWALDVSEDAFTFRLCTKGSQLACLHEKSTQTVQKKKEEHRRCAEKMQGEGPTAFGWSPVDCPLLMYSESKAGEESMALCSP